MEKMKCRDISSEKCLEYARKDSKTYSCLHCPAIDKIDQKLEKTYWEMKWKK